MAINLSTLGIRLFYAVETTAGTMPTTGLKELVGPKSTPDMNPAPDTIETTTLNETEYKTYVDGLKDLGGALDFTFNLTDALITAWEGDSSASPAVAGLMGEYETGKAAGKSTWFYIRIPDLSYCFAFAGNPSHMGLAPTEVSSALEITNRITPTGEPQMVKKSTITFPS